MAFVNVKVILRTHQGDVRAWTADVDPDAELSQLLPDLLDELQLGPADYFRLTVEGSLAVPVLVLHQSTVSQKATPVPVTRNFA